MTAPRTTAEPAGIAVDHDPAVWLPGPTGGATDAEIATWIAGATDACASDFGVADGSDEGRYLREVLSAFASADLPCDFRFLRLRALDDVPLIARLNLFQGMPAGDLDRVMRTSHDPEARLYDDEPQVEVLDEERGLRRWLLFQLRDGIEPIVRHHRRIEEWKLDIVLSCSGPSLKATALGLADLDALAKAVWVVDEEGGRR